MVAGGGGEGAVVVEIGAGCREERAGDVCVHADVDAPGGGLVGHVASAAREAKRRGGVRETQDRDGVDNVFRVGEPL